jgi:hypothetical protein
MVEDLDHALDLNADIPLNDVANGHLRLLLLPHSAPIVQRQNSLTAR